MKRILICLMTAVLLLLLVSCNQKDQDADSDATTSAATTDVAPAPVTPDDELYSFEFVSNGNGTCYVSKIVTDPSNTEEYTLTVPEKSPAGDTVTEIRCEPFSMLVPMMLTENDMNEIEASLQAAVKDGRMPEFYYMKLMTYFSYRGLTYTEYDKTLERWLNTYPIIEETNIAVFDRSAEKTEEQWIAAQLVTYANYDYAKLCEDYNNLKTIAENGSFENKAAVLQSLPALPTAIDNHIVSIRIPDTVEKMDLELLRSCSYLQELILPACVKTVPEEAFSNKFSLKKLVLSEGITEIGNEAFFSCASLEEVVLPSTLTKIGDQAFYGCTALTNVQIPNSVTSLGARAFANCLALENVILSTSLEAIGAGAFLECCALKAVTVPSSVKRIEGSAFSNCTGLTEIVIPEGVVAIGGGAFQYCGALKQLALPSTLESIGGYAFEGCSSVSEFALPKGLKELGEGAFNACDSLPYLIIPQSVEVIGNYFTGYNLKFEIYYEGTLEQWKSFQVLVKGKLRYFSAEKPPLVGVSDPTYLETQYDLYWRYVDGVPISWKIR